MDDGPPGTYGEVALVEAEHALVLKGGWTWVLEPAGEGATRLVVRYPYQPGGGPVGAFFYYAFFEPAHFVMESGMMMGIKQRAEAAARGMASVPPRRNKECGWLSTGDD